MYCSELWRLGLYYSNARWYDPNIGRFITEDPIKDGNNWYMYANNNPLRFVDPTGLESNMVLDFFKSSVNHFINKTKNVGENYDFLGDLINPNNREAATEQSLTAVSLADLISTILFSKAIKSDMENIYAQINDQFGEEVEMVIHELIEDSVPKIAGKGFGLGLNAFINKLIGGLFGISTATASIEGKLLKISEKLNEMGLSHDDIDSLTNILTERYYTYTEGDSTFLSTGDDDIISEKRVLEDGTTHQLWFEEGEVVDEATF